MRTAQEIGERVFARLAEIAAELYQIEDDLNAYALRGGRMPGGLYNRRDALWDDRDALQKIVEE